MGVEILFTGNPNGDLTEISEIEKKLLGVWSGDVQILPTKTLTRTKRERVGAYYMIEIEEIKKTITRILLSREVTVNQGRAYLEEIRDHTNELLSRLDKIESLAKAGIVPFV